MEDQESVQLSMELNQTIQIESISEEISVIVQIILVNKKFWYFVSQPKSIQSL